MCVHFDKEDIYELMGKSQKRDQLRRRGRSIDWGPRGCRRGEGSLPGLQGPELVRTGREREGLGGHLINWL